jgi:prevent-host-death family protein
MRAIQASEAKSHLPRLLDEVERGETVIITRHGRAVARIVPEPAARQDEIDRAMRSIAARRKWKRMGTVTVAERLSTRDEGRKYGCRSSWTLQLRHLGTLLTKAIP